MLAVPRIPVSYSCASRVRLVEAVGDCLPCFRVVPAEKGVDLGKTEIEVVDLVRVECGGEEGGDFVEEGGEVHCCRDRVNKRGGSKGRGREEEIVGRGGGRDEAVDHLNTQSCNDRSPSHQPPPTTAMPVAVTPSQFPPDETPSEREQRTVHAVYERIAPHFSATRYKVRPSLFINPTAH